MGALLAEFLCETRNELFPSREACVEFYTKEENFQRLVNGEIGDNLMYKSRARASFFLWPQVCRMGLDATRELLSAKDASSAIPNFESFWRDFHRFVELKHAHGRTAEEILAPSVAIMDYDVAAWTEAGRPHDVRPFRLPRPQEFVFELPLESACELRAWLQVWTPTLKGLTKGVTRLRATAQMRTCRPLPGAASFPHLAAEAV